jgi:thermostable 8-oxoguanine DNA glycosylase
MINPQKITDFNRDEAQLQEFLLFCLIVQGKKAEMQAVKLECFLSFLAHFTGERLPFKMVNIARNYEMDGEDESMFLNAAKKFGLGQYDRLCQAIDDFLLLPPLSQVTIEQLENCFGMGPKSARFFVVHSRPNQMHAILDTHVLKWLRLQGITTPKNTPQGKLYGVLENIFLTFVEKSGQSVAEFDLNIWKTFATL